MKITISGRGGGEQLDTELLVVVGNSGVKNYKFGWRTEVVDNRCTEN